VRIATPKKLHVICQSLKDRGVDAALITDFERTRNAALRYLSGHPTDAELLLFADGHTTLIPWDLELAGKLAEVDEILNPLDFERSYRKARAHALSSRLGDKLTLEILATEPYYEVVKFGELFPNMQIICDPKGIGYAISKVRRIKEPHEIDVIREGCQKTNQLIDMIQPYIEEHPNCREVDFALFLETEMRKLGAEKPSFETLVANATRSAQIHNYPTSSTEPLVKQGLALVDVGLLWKGYATDVTVPMIFGKLNPTQKMMIDTVQQVHDLAISRVKPGALAHEIAQEVIDTLKAKGLTMPYSLGHGIGLEVHEGPNLGLKPTDPSVLKDWVETPLEEGMIFTIEPGVVDSEHGGTRLENDVLVTAHGAEVLTSSRVLRFPMI
jgi:Xaa-Pro aminopeptidase